MEFMTSLQGGLDDQKPSLFELLSEQQLASLIPPSLRYLLAVATHRRPRYLLRVLNSFDELYALLSLAVERYYLRSYGGGFTENFYGLKRERVLRITGGEAKRARLGAPHEMRETLKLRRGDVWRNLAVMVLLPYVKRKLDESYDVHAASVNMLGPTYRDREQYPVDGTVRQRIMWLYKWFLRTVYPSVNAAYYFSLLAFNLAYLFDGSKYHSPWLWLIGTRMRRMNEADSRARALAAQPKPAASTPGARPGQTNSIFSPRVMTQTIYPRLLSSLSILLPTSIFALKFLEWWHASDFARQLSRKANEGLELPPPIISGLPSPPKAKRNSQAADDNESNEKPASRRDSGIEQPPISSKTHLPILTVPAPTSASSADSSNTAAVCPICLGEMVNPTAAQTGFVYCYTCIYKWVDGSHPRQEAFMEGSAVGEKEEDQGSTEESGGGESRVGKWESGVGRDAVTGRRVLGGTSGLRRVMV
ncbi:Pex12 amino terminal region-domain-containing protein [Neohortaea acidophila]|uniref:Peroxisome assembly protein 12 n=1 Tax=Neohortaea acidophila TaxID=245834 RepID=A0A6A6PS90_9PEZI|nr:Pex12 amino terminal region-domain-containing protein [Neohortaea acidophila]KAF2482969.1 Pex12 amino terminal region-domain-containing protein [Neohortaea acidophila]